MLRFYILLFITFSTSSAFACVVSTPSYINLAISTAEKTMFSYGVKSIDEIIPFATISNCRETAAKRRFVMITLGPEVVYGTDNMRGVNFDKEFPESSSCSISNNPLKKIETHDSVKNNFFSKWKFINECVEVHVLENGPRALSFPKDQVGCKVTSLGPQEAVFNGGFCFFKPFAESEYNISVNVKEECKNLSGYKKFAVELQDLEAGVSYYTSSEYKDEINDLSGFGSSSVRISTNPSEILFKTSDDFGILRPTFPGNYPLNDIHLGKIGIQDEGNYLTIKTPLIVDNTCKKVSVDGLSSAQCNYATPFTAEINLLNSQHRIEATWYDGGIAQPQWQGILNGDGFQIIKDAIKVNETYTLEFTFSDPYYDFNAFKKRIQSKIQGFNSKISGLYGVGSGGISTIPEVGSIADVNTMVDIGTIGDVSFPAKLSNLDSSRKRLGSYFSTNLYPPMYEQVCDPESNKCDSVGKPFVKIIAKFKINSDFSLSNLEIERVSKLLGSYKRKITEQPEFSCN